MKIHTSTLQTIADHRLKPFAVRDRRSGRYWAGYPEPLIAHRPLLFTADMFHTEREAVYYLALLVEYEQQGLDTEELPVEILYDKNAGHR